MHAAGRRQRLDCLLVSRGLARTRTQAQALVLAGQVVSRGTKLEKAGLRLPDDVPLEVLPGRRWVSRGGAKLAAGLDRFGIVATDRDALDVGASTGGFTHVLLEAGARRVIALDVGRGQLDWSLRNDPRVHPLEGLNARYLRPEVLPFPPSLAVVDVSFISVRLVLPAIVPCLADGGEIVTLVKPQFEVGRGQVGRGGIVRDPLLHRAVLEEIVGFAVSHRWDVAGVCASPLRGAAGNREFLVHLMPERSAAEDRGVERMIVDALRPDEPDDTQ